MYFTRALALVALLVAATEAAPESHLHLRISEEKGSSPVAEWGQCKSIDKTYQCQQGLICAVQSQYYGQCVKAVADAWGQCAGKGWKGSCKSGSTCVYKDDWYSQCIPK